MTNWQRAMIGLRRASKTERRSMSKIRGHIDSIHEVKPSSGSRIEHCRWRNKWFDQGIAGTVRGGPADDPPLPRANHELIRRDC